MTDRDDDVALRDRLGPSSYGNGGPAGSRTEPLPAEPSRYQLIAELSSDLITCARAHDDVMVFASPAARTLLGRSPTELLGVSLTEFVHPEDAVALERARQEVLAGAARVLVPYRVRHADGHLVWVESVLVPRRDGAGALTEVHCATRDVTARRQAQEDLKQLALCDPVTGLPNRTLLTDRVRHALASLERRPRRIGLLVVDLDGFRAVNDRHGHQAGDEILVQVGQRLAALARPTDTVARLAGDEFVILAEDLTRREDAETIAGRVAEALRPPFAVGVLVGEPVTVTASIGATVTDRDSAADVQEMFRQANLALYRARQTGRRIAVYDGSVLAGAVRRMATERRIRTALTRDRLRVHYQPVIDLRSGRVAAAEALVRIEDPDGALVEPGEFLDVAEHTGLVVDIDRWVVREAVAEAARLGEEVTGGAPIEVSVNVSARSLPHRFGESLADALADFAVPGRRVGVEVAERFLLGGSPAVSSTFERLGHLDVGVGVNDFGVGYAALSYLHQLDLSFVKIDKTVVHRLRDGDRTGRAIVRAVIDLAHDLGLRVVAEGVETAEQLALLRALDCDRAQGFLFARPEPADRLRELLRGRPRW
ncbi:MAG: EAL domain-containing protein [Actinomycetota bacterium]|nr:EAL domain-containing protein [Actinomycetota bacterium]